MSDKVYVGKNVSDLDIGEKSTKISRVNIIVDEEHQYTAGDDTGRTLEKTVPWGSQAMADAILATVKDYEYQPFTATDALIDPAAEIGDGVTVGGVYSILAQKDITNGKMTAAEIAAPSTDEIEDEYPYQSRQLRQQQRIIAQTRSMIIKTANTIDLRVEEAVGSALGKITIEVTNGLDSSNFTLKVGETEIKSPDIKFTGVVTVQSLGKDGTTEIDGSRIKTGQIDAERLNLTGALTFDDFDEASKTNLNNAAAAAGDVKDLANGVYEQDGVDPETTFITKNQIRSAEIIGGVIRAANFTDEEGVGRFNVNTVDNVTRFSFGRDDPSAFASNFSITTDFSQKSAEISGGYMEIASSLNESHIMLSGITLLSGRRENGTYTFYPAGRWDFRYATVSGIS